MDAFDRARIVVGTVQTLTAGRECLTTPGGVVPDLNLSFHLRPEATAADALEIAGGLVEACGGRMSPVRHGDGRHRWINIDGSCDDGDGTLHVRVAIHFNASS